MVVLVLTLWDGPVVNRRLRGAFRFARTVAFIPRICTSQTSEHFLLREFVGTSKTRAFLYLIVRGMYLLLPFPNVGFVHMGPQWCFQCCVHLAVAANKGKCTVQTTQRKWEGGMGHKRNRKSSHMRSQAYLKQILENCCKKIPETREAPQWIKVHGHNCTTPR